jgi:hypothetical protein
MEKNFGESAINIQEERIYAWGRKLRIANCELRA